METKTREWFRRENLFPILGPCLIVFSIPLLLPGLTLTLVAFSDETGFTKYGAIHVLGMVLLALSGLLFIAGCVVKCFACKDNARVNPVDEEDGLHSSSSSTDHSDTVGIVRASTHTSTDKAAVLASTTIIVDKVPRNISGHFDNSNDVDDNDRDTDGEKEGVTSPRSKTDSLCPPSPLTPGFSERHNDSDYSASQAFSFTENSSTPSPSRLPPAGQQLAASVNAATVARMALAERDEGAAAAAVAAAQQGMPMFESTGTARQRIENQRSSMRRGCNFMPADSEDEKRIADTYSKVAQTFPRDSKGMIRGISLVSTASSSFSSAHSLYESFDAEQASVGGDRVGQIPQAQSRGPPPRMPKRAAVASGYFLGQSSSSSMDQSPSKRPGEFQSESFESKHERIGDLSEDTPDHLFKSREGRIGKDDSGLIEVEYASRTAGHEPGNYRMAEIRDISSSSLEKQASSVESPSHGTYSVKSAFSEELLDFKESPLELPDTGEFSQGNLLSEKGCETDFRPLSPIPIQSEIGHDGQATMSGGSLERMVKSSSSMEISQKTKLASSGNNTASLSQSGGEEPTQKMDSGVHSTEEKSKRKKKKKKKRKHRDLSSVVDEENGHCNPEHELETELIRLQQDGLKELSPPRSIMHPHHHPDHHVHFTDTDSIR